MASPTMHLTNLLRRATWLVLLPVLAACAPILSPPGAAYYGGPPVRLEPGPDGDTFVTDYGGGPAPVARYLRRPDGSRVLVGVVPGLPGKPPGLPPEEDVRPMAPPPPRGHLPGRPVGSGSAFAVIPRGLAVTNAHVVENCSAVVGEDGRPLRVLALDRQRDLALLDAGRAFPAVVRFRRGSDVDLGETVLVFGYPYGRALGTGLNVTNGIVTGASGPGGDPSKFQMNAAVQPGNSGGPAVDEAGLLLGVAVGRLNDLEVLRATGTIPQGINFAVRAAEVDAFLAENGVRPVRGEGAVPISTRAVSAAVAPAVFQVICRG